MGKVRIDDLSAVIAGELSDYRQEISSGIKQEVKAVAKACKKEIKDSSPELTGSYKKGWRDSVEFEGDNTIRIVVHNKTDYQLTHLLEYGHAKAGGGRVHGKTHIRPAEQHAAEKLMKRVKVVVKH